MKLVIQSFLYDPRTKEFILPMKNSFTQKKITGPIVTQIAKERNAIKKQIKIDIYRKTSLNVNKIVSLNWGSIHKSGKEELKKMNYLTFINQDKIPKNYKGLNLILLDIDSFIKKIKWDDNKELLKIALEKAINGEIIFDKKERGE